MNYLLYLCFLIVPTLTLSCQEATVPKAVSDAFRAQYPGEDDPDWEIDAHGNWESHFKVNGVKYRADYLPNGAWVETETSIKKKQLPKAIRDAIKLDYSQYKIAELELVDSATKGIFYDVEFKQKGKNKDVEFRPDGSEL